MLRCSFLAMATAVVLSALMLPTSHAQDNFELPYVQQAIPSSPDASEYADQGNPLDSGVTTAEQVSPAEEFVLPIPARNPSPRSRVQAAPISESSTTSGGLAARQAVLKNHKAQTYPGMSQFPPQPVGGEAIQQPGYVNLGAPLYPSPRPNIPIWTGATMITNQAFAPHEMLYAHSYKAMYPPYYHRVKGGWIVTPFGVRSHEKWELQGTQVQVNYRSSHPGIFKGYWHAPSTSYWGGARW